MNRWISVVGAIVLSAACCNSSYGFEWLDRLIGIDLDNSEAQAPAQPVQTYRPYSTMYAPAPYTVGYPAPAAPGCATCGPPCGCAPRTTFRTVYRPVAVTSYQPVVTCDPCGNRVTAMRPVVTYRMQAQVVPCAATYGY